MAKVNGGWVQPHVQRWADACSEATGATAFGTYPGHSPTIERALDVFFPLNTWALSNAIAQFALDHWDEFDHRYMIAHQRIHWNDGRGWIPMEDRGNPTQNHKDHNHHAFNPASRPTPAPTPAPEPVQEDIMASDHILLTYGSGVALWHASGLVVPLATSKQVLGFLDAGATVMDDLTEEQVDQILGKKKAAVEAASGSFDLPTILPLRKAREG